LRAGFSAGDNDVLAMRLALNRAAAALTRLSGRHDAIRARDTLGAANAEATRSSLAQCRAVLDDLARRVDQDLIPH
jgi:hypothetical protein